MRHTKHINYHKDNDGYAAGAIAYKYFTEYGEWVTMNPYTYGDFLDTSKWHEGDDVYFLDVTYDPLKEMIKFPEKYGINLYVIDHHKSVVESDVINYIKDGIITSAKSGCELAWDYFYPNEQIPIPISLLGRYDRWDRSDEIEWNEGIEPFQLGFSLKQAKPQDDIWFTMDLAEITSTIEEGRTIKLYTTVQNAKTMRRFMQEVEFEGIPGIICNATEFSSNLFNSVWDPDKYKFMMVYNKDPKEYKLSCYTTHSQDVVDMHEVCKAAHLKFGGHLQAFGMSADQIIINKGKLHIIQ
jgi:oligoribonuclease NrnB/cAMP/cGMP phosphodiesterase (DHH superfamily)